MKRYEKIVLEAEKGITFEVLEGTSSELIIRALNIKKTNVNIDDENYANPPIPEGYEHICGKWNTGFVIRRCSDGSQFVWVPVGCLDSNGSIKGIKDKFGRRDYCGDKFSDGGFHETLTKELALQIESVKKYGGFYISRYNISKNKKTGNPQSIEGAMPWTDINFHEAKKIAATLEDNERVKSHLTYGTEYDSVLEWFIKSEERTLYEIAKDSTKWGNYKKRTSKTGKKEEYCTNNIYDFAGNVAEWTQEEDGVACRLIRGCSAYWGEGTFTAAYRDSRGCSFRNILTGFRAVLYIK